MDPQVHKTKQPVEQKKETKNELDVLKCPKLDLDGEIKLVYGEGIALNSAKEFNRYIGSSIDRRGGEIANAVSSGAEQIMRDIGLGQTTKREIMEQERLRQETETSVRGQHKRKTSLELEEEEKIRLASRDEVRAEKRQDMASKGESDGGEVGHNTSGGQSLTGEDKNESLEVFTPNFEDDE